MCTWLLINRFSILKVEDKAGKQVHSRRRSQTCHIAKHSSRSISASSAFKNASPEALALYSLEESKKEDMSLDPKISTTLRVITGRLSSKKVLSLKLSAVFSYVNFWRKNIYYKPEWLCICWEDQLLGF